MSIFSKLKTATDFSASVIKEGFALIWPEKQSDGTIKLRCKLEDGSVKDIAGGDGTVDEDRLLPKVSSNGDIPIRADNTWTAGNLDNIINGKIDTHNNAENAHPMHNTTEADFNNITESGFYNQYNQSSVNAPLDFDIGYFLIVSKYEDSTNTSLVQIALPRLEDAIRWIYTRYAIKDASSSALEWTKWSCTKGEAHYLTETDFNTVVDSGNYLISQGSAGSPNSPTNTTYLLNVTAYTEVGLARIFQTATKHSTGTSVQEIYTRVGVRETAGGAVVWNDWLRLSNAPTVISNPDYNQVTTTGTYYMSTGSGSQNAPDQSSYMLTVLSYKETSWERIFQIAVRYVTNTQPDKQAVFTRIGDRTTSDGEIVWTRWSGILSSESIGTITNDYNLLTTPGSYYLSYGDNSSNLNAPANGPFHILVHQYSTNNNDVKRLLQIAINQSTDASQNSTIYVRTARWVNSAWSFSPWTTTLNQTHRTEKDAHPMLGQWTGDFNTMVESGSYYVSASSLSNAPDGGAAGTYFLTVGRYLADDAYTRIIQVCYPRQPDRLRAGYVRQAFKAAEDSGLTWTGWQLVSTDRFTGVPKYGSRVAITTEFNTGNAFTYTFTENGWCFLCTNTGGGTYYAGSGNSEVVVADNGDQRASGFFPVAKGTVLHGTAAVSILIFYPNDI